MTSPSAAETSAPTTNPPATAGPASGTKNAWAGGLTVFAGVVLATVGVFQFFQGLAAVIKGGFYVVARTTFTSSASAVGDGFT